MININIHAKIFLVSTADFEAVVSYGAATQGETVMGAFMLACESLDLDPDDYPVPNQDWVVSLVGSPVTTYMQNRVLVIKVR